MAREAVRLGMPPDLVTKMIMTPPASMYWLSRDDVVALAGSGAIAKESAGRD